MGTGTQTRRNDMPPMYSPEMVQPMRDELTVIGCEELLTPDDVRKTIEETKGVLFIMINSVCGCAAGSARPGLALALQHKIIPDKITTVFAGMEKEAVGYVRAQQGEYPPSSPSMLFLKDGKLIHMIGRGDIETRQAPEVAELLISLFDKHCTKAGPSIPPEEFAKLSHAKICGSQLPRIDGVVPFPGQQGSS